MSKLPVHQLKTNSKELDLGDAKVFHLPAWHGLTHPQRLGVLRQIAMMRGRDPRIAKLAVSIFKNANAQPRQYEKQAAALLKWVQDPKNCYYANEPGERLQDPIHTIKVGHGDCFAEDTLLLREDMEFVKIQDVKVGERIWGKDKWSTVVNFWDKGSLPITEIELNNGSVARLTEGHKVYVKSCPKHGPTCKDLVGQCANCKDRDFDWIRIQVSELVEGMVLLQPERIERQKPSGSWDADDSWFMGAYIAEGWSEDCRVSVSGKDGHWKEQTKHRAKAIAERKGWVTRWNSKYLAINSKDAVAWVAECGKGALNKQIPVAALRDADAEALDIGLRLDSSKNSRGEGWTFGSISPLLALQYRTLQRVLGRSTSWSKVVDHGGFGSNPIYRVGVRNPSKNNDRRLRVSAIRRNVEQVPCYDIATDDHYVYLPEADCTVSNCDDQILLLTCLFESVGLPWKLVLSGRASDGSKVRYIEGSGNPPNGVNWSHIYCMVGTPPFGVQKWFYCETTIIGVPLGWDVVSGDARFLPEMMKRPKQPAQIVSPVFNGRWATKPLPPKAQRSPAYAEVGLGGYGDSLVDETGAEVGAFVGRAVTEIKDELKDPAVQKTLKSAVMVGVAVSVTTSLIMQFINGDGLWKGKGHVMERWFQTSGDVARHSKLFTLHKLSY